MTYISGRPRLAEPGYYKDGQYGIRIENIVIVREAQTPNNFGDKGYLRFEHVTMVRAPPLSTHLLPLPYTAVLYTTR